MYIMYKRIGDDLITLALKLHLFAQYDIASLIGTKNSVLKANPVGCLKDFAGRIHLRNDEAVNAKQYLVKVLSTSLDSLSFYQLRVEVC